MRKKNLTGLLLALSAILFTTCKKSDTLKDPILYDNHSNSNQYVILGGKWNKSNITWFISKPCNGVSLTTLKTTIQQAFNVWGSQVNLTFSEAANSQSADIILSWGETNHPSWVDNSNCQAPFETGVLAHAWGPPPINPYLSGDIHFWNFWNWTPNGEVNGSSVSILSIAIHEIGHSLGLNHSLDRSAIMFASYDPTNPKFTLSADDIAGIKSIYGNTNNGNPTTNFIDSRDGQSYRTVTIGSQTWLAENFRYNSPGSVAYNNDATNVTTNGRLYTWQEASNSVPNGWRIPTDDDWKQLEILQGMSQSQANYFGIGNDRYNPLVASRLLVGGTSGLNLTLSGYFPIQYGFFELNTHGYYWTSTPFDGQPAMWERDITATNVNRVGMSTTATRISLRLIKN